MCSYGLCDESCYNCASRAYCTCTGKSLVTATGGYTPQQLAAGLPGQCTSGAGGATGFPACVNGAGLAICKSQVTSSATDTVAGWFGSVGTQIQKQLSAIPSLKTILIILFIALLATVFVYGYAKSR